MAHRQRDPAPDVTIWMPQSVAEACEAEASDLFPLETGGVFMGWWAGPTTAVVTAWIGPGPNALHGHTYFEPDQKWQLEQIAAHFHASHGGETYLGDWHTHPGAVTGVLSATDRGVVRRVAASPSAQCPFPVMLVYFGTPDLWQLAAWVGRPAGHRVWSHLDLQRVLVRMYDASLTG